MEFQIFHIVMLKCSREPAQLIVAEKNLTFVRGGITKKNGKIWDKFLKGRGGNKKQTKIPNFNLGIVITQVAIFQKCLK